MLILPAEGPNLPEQGGKVSLCPAQPSSLLWLRELVAGGRGGSQQRLRESGVGSQVAGEEASRGAAAPRSGTQVHPGLQHLLASVTCQLDLWF